MDSAGRIWDAHGPIHGGRSPEALARSLGLSPGSPAVLDAVYLDQGQEYLDAVALEGAEPKH